MPSSNHHVHGNPWARTRIPWDPRSNGIAVEWALTDSGWGGGGIGGLGARGTPWKRLKGLKVPFLRKKNSPPPARIDKHSILSVTFKTSKTFKTFKPNINLLKLFGASRPGSENHQAMGFWHPPILPQILQMQWPLTSEGFHDPWNLSEHKLIPFGIVVFQKVFHLFTGFEFLLFSLQRFSRNLKFYA